MAITRVEGSKPNFADVKAGAWYTGWINASESLGIFQGDGNGKFRPNDTISNQEVITVLMRMLGYNDNLPGAWPVNYVTEANKQDITEDVNIVASAAAKRGDVVVMLDATLDTNLVTYDKDTNEFVLKQTTKSDSEYITLLGDAFDGTYDEVAQFDAVNEVREAADGTLNWIAGNKTFIIDANTTVSTNGGSLFDLKGHQGKVYYTVDSGKYYAKYIEVDSYRVLVSDLPKYDSATDKVIVNKTKYSTAPDVYDKDDKKVREGVTFYNEAGAAGVTDNTDLNTLGKNSKYVLYLNDDDQVYYVTSDKEDTDKAFFVKSVGSSTIKLIGDDTETIDADEDSLVWTEDGFITTEELEVGDAIVMIDDDLFVKTEAATGVLKSKTSTKWNIDGSEYVSGNAAILDDEYEDGAADIEDIYGNTVTYLLNDDNSVAAIIVDEVTIGTKLYGIVVDGDDSTGSWKQGTLSSVSIFTAEGTTVEYDFDDDYDNSAADEATELMGRLVEYKLNKDGEIKDMSVPSKDLLSGETVDVKNNAYLVGKTNLTLANNVAIFEVDVDDNEVDVNLVTRAALLAEDDIKPGKLDDVAMGTKTVDGKTVANLVDIEPYFAYVTNTNGAAKAIAYTNAGSTTKYFGVIDAFDFADSDVDHGVTLVGDDNVYEFKANDDGKAIVNGATDDDLIIYTKSGDKITVVKAYADKTAVAGAKEVKGYVDGLITLVDGAKIAPVAELDEAGKGAYSNIMTDSETVVYVTNSKTGKFEEGTLDDISKGDIVYVPAIDEDEYADLVIVDEYAAATSVLTKMTVVVGGNAATITDGKMALTVNQEVNLNANDADGNDIGYSKGLRFATSDASVVDFKEDADGKKDLYGNIVAKKAGTATITVTYLDATVEIEVTVTAAQ